MDEIETLILKDDENGSLLEYFHIQLDNYGYNPEFTNENPALKFIIDSKTKFQLLNIGTGEEISIYNLANKIKSIVNFNGEIIFNKDYPDGNPRKLLDSKKINELGWKSKVSLDEGLLKTYDWFLENNN